MSFAEIAGDPDDSLGLEARKIRKYLAQMTVVGAFELVLYQDSSVICGIVCQYVRGKLIHGDFLANGAPATILQLPKVNLDSRQAMA